MRQSHLKYDCSTVQTVYKGGPLLQARSSQQSVTMRLSLFNDVPPEYRSILLDGLPQPIKYYYQAHNGHAIPHDVMTEVFVQTAVLGALSDAEFESCLVWENCAGKERDEFDFDRLGRVLIAKLPAVDLTRALQLDHLRHIAWPGSFMPDTPPEAVFFGSHAEMRQRRHEIRQRYVEIVEHELDAKYGLATQAFLSTYCQVGVEDAETECDLTALYHAIRKQGLALVLEQRALDPTLPTCTIEFDESCGAVEVKLLRTRRDGSLYFLDAVRMSSTCATRSPVEDVDIDALIRWLRALVAQHEVAANATPRCQDAKILQEWADEASPSYKIVQEMALGGWHFIKASRDLAQLVGIANGAAAEQACRDMARMLESPLCKISWIPPSLERIRCVIKLLPHVYCPPLETWLCDWFTGQALGAAPCMRVQEAEETLVLAPHVKRVRKSTARAEFAY